MSDEEAKSITFDDRAMADAVRGGKLLALVVRKEAGDAQKGDSRALSNPWDAVESVDGIIPPPLCPWALELMVETNTELPSSIAAMEVNVAGFGWRLKRLPGVTDSTKVEKEREDLHEFLTYADYDNQSFTSLRRSSRVDLETTGNWYWEVTRDRIGNPYGFRLLPSHTMRLTKIDRWPTKVDQVRPTGSGNDRSTKIIRRWRHFKRFVQASVTVASDEPELIYFKEYGDPRPLNWRTGEYGTKESPVHVDDLATDLLHFKIHSSRTPYGLPRWAGTILTVQGLRLAEEINFTTFQNNNIPSLAIMVSNGALTDATVDRLTKFMESNVQGDDSYSKIVVIEAVPSSDAEDGDSSQVRMTLEPLKGVQHTDELFQTYDENGRGKIRRTFRLPPIFSGDSASYERNTAETSRKLADEQVFNPERMDEDWVINRILVDMGALYHRFETNTPNVTNDKDLIEVMKVAEKTGAMTPALGRSMVEDIMGKDLGPVDPSINPDVPFSLTIAERIKNQAQPTEPGQQVTAMKALRHAGLAEDWGDVIDLVELAKSRGGDAGGHDVVLNVGSQAGDIAAGTQAVYLSATALGLDGRELLIADGVVAKASVRFGVHSRLPLAAAAGAAGLEASDVAKMFPGRAELWVLPIDARDKLTKEIAYTPQEGSVFGFVTGKE